MRLHWYILFSPDLVLYFAIDITFITSNFLLISCQKLCNKGETCILPHWVYYKILVLFYNQNGWSIYNNNEALTTMVEVRVCVYIYIYISLGWLLILNSLVKVDHMYSFPPFYYIRSHTLCYFLNWHVLFYYYYYYYYY